MKINITMIPIYDIIVDIIEKMTFFISLCVYMTAVRKQLTPKKLQYIYLLR